MKMLVVVSLGSDEAKHKVLKAVKDLKISGIAVKTSGLIDSVLQSDVDPIPHFGFFRHLVDSKSVANDLVLLIVEKDELSSVKEAIKNSCANMQSGTVGKMFAIEIAEFVEDII